MMNSKLSSKPSMAVFQIAVLILGTFAFAYLFGGMVPSVSAQSGNSRDFIRVGNKIYKAVEDSDKVYELYAKNEQGEKKGEISDETNYELDDGVLKDSKGDEIGKVEAKGPDISDVSVTKVGEEDKEENNYPVYTVEDDDTLYDIAKQYDGVSVNQIKEENKLKTNKITIGQRLTIPTENPPDNDRSQDDETLYSISTQEEECIEDEDGPYEELENCKEYLRDSQSDKGLKKEGASRSGAPTGNGGGIFAQMKNQLMSQTAAKTSSEVLGLAFGENDGEGSDGSKKLSDREKEIVREKLDESDIEPKGEDGAYSENQIREAYQGIRNAREEFAKDLGQREGTTQRFARKVGRKTDEELNNYLEEDLDVKDASDYTKTLERESDAEEYVENREDLSADGSKGSEIIEKAKSGTVTVAKQALVNGAEEAGKGFFGQVGSAFTKGAGASGVSNAAYIFTAALSAFAAAELVVLGFSMGGASDRNVRDLQRAAYGTGIAALAGASLASGGAGFWTSGVAFGIYGAAAMGVFIALSYQQYSQETYEYQVSSWQPEFGGENCNKCNELRYGCSEYQCHTYGRACELVNKGTKQERCTWKNEDDITPPVMSPMNSSLENNQEYKPMETQVPDDRGVQITNPSHPDGCLPAFSGAEIGVNTDDLAECKVDIERRQSYENMTSHFSQGTSLVKNHTLTIPGAAMPSDSAGEASDLPVENGEMNRYYAQCKDVNGNPSPNNLVVGFCVEEGPDTQAPVIEGTNYLNESFISSNQTTVPLEVYTNEPATCRWSRTNVGYSQMENNLSQCSQNMQDYLIDSSFQYGCSGNISGIKGGQANDYYIKCKDKPWLAGKQGTSDEKRIENKESFELTLEGTEPLVIRNVTVNGRPNGTTIKDSTDSIRANLKVETAGGAERGNAKCSYSIDGGNFNFYNNGTTGFVGTNTQELYLSEGNYNIPIQCNDAGGNVAESSVSFTIDQDNAQPQVTRTYRDEENLRVLTSEGANCVYNTNPSLGCTYNFDDGVEMEQVDDETHYVEWDSNTRYYVKCADEFGNQPAPDQCSVTVRAYDL